MIAVADQKPIFFARDEVVDIMKRKIMKKEEYPTKTQRTQRTFIW
jgi:hypothetical protein